MNVSFKIYKIENNRMVLEISIEDNELSPGLILKIAW